MAAIYSIKKMPNIERECLTVEDILNVMSYDEISGVFTWRVVTRGHAKMLYPGDEAGWEHDGYRMLMLYGNEYRAHRVAWFIKTSSWPEAGFDIDHADRNRMNNAWINLRMASRSQNNMNSKVRKDNTSGARGVHRTRNGKRWFARICKDQEIIGLGTFDSFDEALAARKSAERQLFGEFSRHSELETMSHDDVRIGRGS